MDAVVGLGANLGDRLATLGRAVREIGQLGAIVSVSRLYETEPVGPPQPHYLNAAVRLRCDRTPRALLDALLAIERAFGRVRSERFGPRTLDLDILFIDDRAVADEGLVVPHPRLHERRFALEPLLDVAPTARDPATQRPLRAWLHALPDQGVRVVDEEGWSRVY